MKTKGALLLACLAACEIGVDVGSRDGAGPFDAGAEEQFCPAAARLVAFEVRLDAMPLTEPSCWLDGAVPANHTLPEETFEVLVATSTTTTFSGAAGTGGGSGTVTFPVREVVTLGLAGLGPQRLGDAPVIEVGAAMTGFEWQRTHTTRVRRFAQEERFTTARFEFDRLDLSQSAGQLVLSARWSCLPFGTGCTRPADRQSCSVTRPFVARRLPDVPARWTTPITPEVEGAEPYLVSLDLGALSRAGMTCAPPELVADVTDSTPTLRALEVWQLATDVIRLPGRRITFPVAPSLELESDFQRDSQSVTPQLHARDRALTGDGLERRSSSALMYGRRCGASFADAGAYVREAELVLESRYDCFGDAGCAAVRSADRGTCRVVLPWLPMLLPAPFVTGP